MSLESAIEKLVEDSLDDGRYYHYVTYGISDNTVRRLQKDTSMNFAKYVGIVDSDHIRHIKRRHPESIPLIKYAPKILDQYDYAEKSLTRNQQTGQTDISIVLKKKLDDGKYIQMVKLRVMKNKTLLIKTLFVLD